MSGTVGRFVDPCPHFHELNELTTEHVRLREQHQRLTLVYDQKQQEIAQLKAMKTQDQKDMKHLLEQYAVLESQNAGLRMKVQNCKDDLFKLQPVSQVPDSVISQQYEALSSAISDWVDDEVARFSDAWQQRNGEEPPEIFHHGEIDHIKDILALYPDSGGEYVLRCVISYALHCELFSHTIFLFGLPVAESEGLRYTARSMKSLEPPRESSAIRSWKAETLTAIAATAAYRQSRADATQELCISLIKTLVNVFPTIGDCEVCQANLYHRLVKPAVDLAVKIQTSATKYRFEPCMSPNSILGRYPVTLHDLSETKMIDIKSGKHLRAESQVVPGDGGEIGDQLLVLAPALLRRQSGKKSIRLTQELILVELYKPLGRQGIST